MVLWGYDTDNRPALYLRPSKQNTEESIRQVHFVVWALERLTELMGPGVEYVHFILAPCPSRSWNGINTGR